MTDSSRDLADDDRSTDSPPLDLSDAYNRIADTWNPILVSAGPVSMPIAACGYPVNMGEQTIAAIRDEVSPEDYFLRWQMAAGSDGHADTLVYDLYCNWQGRAWEREDGRYLFIENAVGWVDLVDGDVAARVEIMVMFGRPQFVDRMATMSVEYFVREIVDDAVVREASRPFQIYADGSRERLF
jgi:hypothetical protein